LGGFPCARRPALLLAHLLSVLRCSAKHAGHLMNISQCYQDRGDPEAGGPRVGHSVDARIALACAPYIGTLYATAKAGSVSVRHKVRKHLQISHVQQQHFTHFHLEIANAASPAFDQLTVDAAAPRCFSTATHSYRPAHVRKNRNKWISEQIRFAFAKACCEFCDPGAVRDFPAPRAERRSARSSSVITGGQAPTARSPAARGDWPPARHISSSC